MLNITLSDGKGIKVEEGKNVSDVIKQISNSLAKEAVSAMVDGDIVPLDYRLDKDVNLEVFNLTMKKAKIISGIHLLIFWHRLLKNCSPKRNSE